MRLPFAPDFGTPASEGSGYELVREWLGTQLLR